VEPQSLRAELSERDRLEARGYRDGYAAATWFSPQDEETARRILGGVDEGDPEVLDSLPAPRLGGEFADEPTWSTILEEEGCEHSDDGRPELLDAYCYAYSCAVERELVRSCRALLGLFGADLRVRSALLAIAESRRQSRETAERRSRVSIAPSKLRQRAAAGLSLRRCRRSQAGRLPMVASGCRMRSAALIRRTLTY
jgi:hypothetical protein